MLLRTILLVVETISALLLVGIILIQKSKGGGFGTAFGASMGESILGSRAGNVLTRGTVILSAVFLVNTLLLALIYSGQQERSLVERHLGRSVPAPSAVQQPSAAGQATAQQAPGDAATMTTLPGVDLDDNAAPTKPIGDKPLVIEGSAEPPQDAE